MYTFWGWAGLNYDIGVTADLKASLQVDYAKVILSNYSGGDLNADCFSGDAAVCDMECLPRILISVFLICKNGLVKSIGSIDTDC